MLIPYLTGYTPGPGGSVPGAQSFATARAYVNWMKQNVFGAAGFSNIEPRAPATNPSLYYAFPDLGLNGIDTGQGPELQITGAGTWHLSALQLASLMWTLAVVRAKWP